MEKYYKNPRIQAAALIIVLVVVGWLAFKKPVEKANNTTPLEQTQQQQAEPVKNTTISSPNTWEGVLKASNNSQKGNLMLETKERTIYLKTSRDFSQLLGKDVVVGYEGTLDSFALGDITAK